MIYNAENKNKITFI